MYLPFARGLLILVIVLGKEVFARPATGKFRFISNRQKFEKLSQCIGIFHWSEEMADYKSLYFAE